MINDPSTRTGYLAWQFGQATAQRLEKALRPLDLNLAQLRSLVQVSLTPGISSAEIARRSGLTAQSMGAAVTSLVGRGLIEREPHPANRRVLELRATDAGRDLAHVAQRRVDEVQEEMLAVLTTEEQHGLHALLRRLVEHAAPESLYLTSPERPEHGVL
ncbi:MarR family winged helix-turn-helix transcriptional regulator [Streptacidiphilus sp. P02-A3a]|uniref:MarR family winged helix-turn-helix transcriptional regulator n=1 Tax=Streptacidiphilus sp. P02-A3a TaxID=2704468 RepID=UPI0015F856AE|nr:MarR family transcriptional regulator [Streptacidiphilus sp. P02-A3a]QMU68956.1 MarR family transcriptional regulator [Streptacidiphilus sp. P02-A3a]